MRDKISPSILRQLLRYDPESGQLFWLARDRSFFSADGHWKRWNSAYANKQAFTAAGGPMGHKTGRIFGQLYYAHIIAWAIHYGEWPSENIDHIHGSQEGNRITNLRLADQQTNMENKKGYANNSSGATGVSWHISKKRWASYITVKKKRINLGYFKTIEEAKQVRLLAQVGAGFHENHGRLN